MNLITIQPDIDKIYLYAKDPYEGKYQYLINKREKVGLNYYGDPKDPVVTELFIRGSRFNISIVFITQSYFKVPKDVRLNSKHFFIIKIPNKRELQEIALNHSSDIDFKDFMKIF